MAESQKLIGDCAVSPTYQNLRAPIGLVNLDLDFVHKVLGAASTQSSRSLDTLHTAGCQSFSRASLSHQKLGWEPV